MSEPASQQPQPAPPLATPGGVGGPQTLWGLHLAELHDRFWAAKGVQVVRVGERSAIVPHAELFLLSDARTLVIFRPAPLLDRMHWLAPDLVGVRLSDRRSRGYTERVEADAGGRFRRFARVYEGTDPHLARVGLTTDPEIARIWQSAESPRAAWQRLRLSIAPQARFGVRLDGRVFSAESAEDCALFVRELVRAWPHPDATVDRLDTPKPRVWSHASAQVHPDALVRGPLWIGAGRALCPTDIAVGPPVIWDDPAHRPPAPPVQWQDIESRGVPEAKRPGSVRARPRPGKRAFDIAFALAAMLLTLPLYPIVAILIAIEDGFPIFFGHERESQGGRRFKCLKFRSMRRDAEKMKAQLATQNKADGPQFYIPDDPRLTRVGRVIRALQIDELPQFWNVLVGDMSIVGPRPSPFHENQYCPPWREARLSVRPGITGLWQIRRTRAEGADFQEWIKYDIEYVERQTFLLDLWIIWRTVLLILRKATIA